MLFYASIKHTKLRNSWNLCNPRHRRKPFQFVTFRFSCFEPPWIFSDSQRFSLVTNLWSFTCFFRFLGFQSNLLELKRFQLLEVYTDSVFGYLYDMQMNFEEFFLPDFVSVIWTGSGMPWISSVQFILGLDSDSIGWFPSSSSPIQFFFAFLLLLFSECGFTVIVLEVRRPRWRTRTWIAMERGSVMMIRYESLRTSRIFVAFVLNFNSGKLLGFECSWGSSEFVILI